MSRFLPDPLILMLLGTLALATLYPATGVMVPYVDNLANAAIMLLFFLNGVRLPRENLLAALTDVYARSPEKDVVIKADRGLKYRDVREVMRVVQQAGFSGAGIETHRRGADSPQQR